MHSLELDSKQKMERILQLQEKNFHAVVQTPGLYVAVWWYHAAVSCLVIWVNFVNTYAACWNLSWGLIKAWSHCEGVSVSTPSIGNSHRIIWAIGSNIKCEIWLTSTEGFLIKFSGFLDNSILGLYAKNYENRRSQFWGRGGEIFFYPQSLPHLLSEGAKKFLCL